MGKPSRLQGEHHAGNHAYKDEDGNWRKPEAPKAKKTTKKKKKK